MFGGNYPITSLKPDDPRTLRFLKAWTSEMRVADRHKRVLQTLEGRGDPGPTYLEQLASAAEQIARHYEARDYNQANQLQKALGNRLARLASDPSFDEESPRQAEAQIIEFWKTVWKQAANEMWSRTVIEGNSARVIAKEIFLSWRAGSAPTVQMFICPKCLETAYPATSECARCAYPATR
jgi:hypothetical protein